MKRIWKTIWVFATMVTVSSLAHQLVAQESAATTTTTESPLQGVVDGLAGKYGWLTTVLIVIGILRVLVKPVMTAIEGAVANDPARLAALQKFEAGPIFRTISFLLDLGASIKVKPTVVATTVRKSEA